MCRQFSITKVKMCFKKKVVMSRAAVERSAHSEVGVNIVNAFLHQNVMRTPVTEAYTSNQNVRFLMDYLINAVYQQQGQVIGPQSIQALATIMVRQYAESGPYFTELVQPEVERLNRGVLQTIIHNTTQSTESYNRYLRDAFTQPVPPDRPQNVSTRGSRQFEINRFL